MKISLAIGLLVHTCPLAVVPASADEPQNHDFDVVRDEAQAPPYLYAVAIAAWKSADRPVLLNSGSRLRFTGRTQSAHSVRFGFSTQKMRGAFAGKFEIDLQAAALGRAGETWEVDIPLKDFRPLHPQLIMAPGSLELTIRDDAGMEINRIALVPAAVPE